MFRNRERVRMLEATAATLISENDTLRVKIAELQAENRTLRKRLPKPELRILRRAHLDAELLIAAHLGGLPTSRRESISLGISHRRWNWACALLAIARLRARSGEWRECDPAQVMLRLDVATAQAEKKGIALLEAHASKWGYSGQHLVKGATCPAQIVTSPQASHPARPLPTGRGGSRRRHSLN